MRFGFRLIRVVDNEKCLVRVGPSRPFTELQTLPRPKASHGFNAKLRQTSAKTSLLGSGAATTKKMKDWLGNLDSNQD